MCERSEFYALGCAVARAFPRYSKVSGVTAMFIRMIKVAFVFVGDKCDPLSDQEIQCLQESAKGN